MAAGDGLISMTPTSIAHAGTAASINADGGVDFTAVTSLSLNGVFTSDYDNYLIVLTSIGGPTGLSFRMRASGSDASGSDYADQYVLASSTSVTGARSTSQTSVRLATTWDTLGDGRHIHFYGPALAQPTAFRSVAIYARDSAWLEDYAGTHSLSTAYDGFTITCSAIDGNIHVFGYEE